MTPGLEANILLFLPEILVTTTLLAVIVADLVTRRRKCRTREPARCTVQLELPGGRHGLGDLLGRVVDSPSTLAWRPAQGRARRAGPVQRADRHRARALAGVRPRHARRG